MNVFSVQLLEKAGFSEVRAEDRTQQFINILTTEKTRLELSRDEFQKVGKVGESTNYDSSNRGMQFSYQRVVKKCSKHIL